jgi:HAD superfamily hydrolase (TIGR01490 family)
MNNKRFAFFDVDDTLISIKSMFDFFSFWGDSTGAHALVDKFEQYFAQARKDKVPREELNRMYYRFLRGTLLSDLEATGRDWFADRFNGTDAPYIKATIARLRAHQDNQVEVVFVSGSMPPLLQPLAETLGVSHCLCARLILDNDQRLTGEIGTPQTIGDGKAEAIRIFVDDQKVQASQCYGYGDDISDLPLLESIGHPVAVASNGLLFDIAKNRNWEIIAHH